MKLTVFGAPGMLGRDVARSAEAAGHELVALGGEDVDVVDRAAVDAALSESRPDVVFNCAAYTDVDGAESEEQAATRVNGDGARNVAAAAAAVGASVLYPSTDYVFDGQKGQPYVESDPVGPLSAYGRSKLAGERATADANPRHLIVRTQWLFGLGGRNFVETMLRLGAERDELTVVDDQVGCPTYTCDLAAALVGLTGREDWGVHHVAGGGECSWNRFAREIFERAGVSCRVLAGTTEELGRPAPRPAHAVLRSQRPGAPVLPHWRVGLDRYLVERAAAEARA
jgi:dTDP-4-dehydrorhamnose reductase